MSDPRQIPIDLGFTLRGAPPTFSCCICVRLGIPGATGYSRQEITNHYKDGHKDLYERGVQCLVCQNFFLQLCGHPCMKYAAGVVLGDVPEEVLAGVVAGDAQHHEVPPDAAYIINCLKFAKAGGVFSHMVFESFKHASDVDDLGFYLNGIGLLLTGTSWSTGLVVNVTLKVLGEQARMLAIKFAGIGTTTETVSKKMRLVQPLVKEAEEIWERVQAEIRQKLQAMANEDPTLFEDDGWIIVPPLAIDYVRAFSNLTRGIAIIDVSSSSVVLDALIQSVDEVNALMRNR